MGMDVQGINPNGAIGQRFGRGSVCWASLWDYCRSVSSLARQVKLPYSNDGDGLDARRASSLAKTLQDELENGRTSEYIAQQGKMLAEQPEELPDKACHRSRSITSTNKMCVTSLTS